MLPGPPDRIADLHRSHHHSMSCFTGLGLGAAMHSMITPSERAPSLRIQSLVGSAALRPRVDGMSMLLLTCHPNEDGLLGPLRMAHYRGGRLLGGRWWLNARLARSRTDGLGEWTARVETRQPAGGFNGLGTSPATIISSRCSSGCEGKAAENRAVYTDGAVYVAAHRWCQTRTILPRYMTAMFVLDAGQPRGHGRSAGS